MKKDYIKHILYSGIIGAIFWIIGEVMYDLLTKKIWQPLGIALYFCIFAIIMVIGMYLLAIFRGDYNKAVDKGSKPISDNFGTIVLLIVIFFITTGTFEFLYELGGKTIIKEPTSYVFLIDDSGSMSGNDPNCERATAIKKIMENQDANFPYSVYRFTSESQMLKEMGPYSQDDNYQFDSKGGTDIIGSLNSVLDEIIANKSIDDSPRIMLVSDGSSSAFGSNSVIDKCNDNGVSISSISFGNLFGNSLLNKLSTRTGGVYVDVENIDDLYTKMQTAITSDATRNLISERYMPRLNWLYAILRIVFLFIMSLLWAAIKNIAYCGNKRNKNEENYSYDNVVVFTVISAFISILLMEFGTAYVAIPEKAARLLLSILWMIIPGKFYIVSEQKPNLTGVGSRNFGLENGKDTKVLQPDGKGFDSKKKTLDAGTGKSFGNTKGGFGNTSNGFGTKRNFGGFSGNQNHTESTGGFGKKNGSNSNTFSSGSNSNGGGFGKK